MSSEKQKISFRKALILQKNNFCKSFFLSNKTFAKVKMLVFHSLFITSAGLSLAALLICQMMVRKMRANIATMIAGYIHQ